MKYIIYRDFYSDIVLAFEIMSNELLFEKLFLFIAGFGSMAFVIIPYATNIIIASRIKNIIKNNPAAKGWFNYFTPIFTLLVVLCGGCHSALTVVSSNIFGMRIFSSGLTRYELKKLNRIRIIGTVLIENVPQLACQALYTVALDYQATQAVWFAFIASSLSIIATTLSYLIEKDTSDTMVAEYYISLEKTPLTAILTDQETQSLRDNGRRTGKLGQSMAEVFGLASKNIEVGYSATTRYGIIMHVVHYVYKDDLEMMEEELFEENPDRDIIVTPKYYVSQVFASLAFDINKVFWNHFGLGKEFQVLFHHRLSVQKGLRSPRKKTSMFNNGNGPTEPASPKHFNRRATILRAVIDNHDLKMDEDVDPEEERKAKSEAIRAIESYCSVRKLKSRFKKKQCIMQLMDSINEMESMMVNYAIHGSDDMGNIIQGTGGDTLDILNIANISDVATNRQRTIELQRLESFSNEY